MKGERVAVPERRTHAARIVAAFHALDLEHLGAQVGEHGPGKRAGQHLAQFQHTDAAQHTRHAIGRRCVRVQAARRRVR